jgi:NAD(P)H-dependent flavin oxidoreductase YrpB (nitropropane dioxygenase family)
MRVNTKVTKMLNIQHPIVMGEKAHSFFFFFLFFPLIPLLPGGMTGVGTPELAAAVSNAGGLVSTVSKKGRKERKRKKGNKMRPIFFLYSAIFFLTHHLGSFCYPQRRVA